MDNNFNPSISVEELAAYLDGNLEESTMNSMNAIVHNDNNLAALIEDSQHINRVKQDYNILFGNTEDYRMMDLEDIKDSDLGMNTSSGDLSLMEEHATIDYDDATDLVNDLSFDIDWEV